MQCQPCAWRNGSVVSGSDVLPTHVGRGRVVYECPPCRGIEVPKPLTERAIVRRYEKTMRESGHLPEVVDLDEVIL